MTCRTALCERRIAPHLIAHESGEGAGAGVEALVVANRRSDTGRVARPRRQMRHFGEAEPAVRGSGDYTNEQILAAVPKLRREAR
jgi:hypothetical protein